MSVQEVETPHGTARVHLRPAPGTARAALVLGHGAGVGVGSPDITAATEAANAAGVSVALVEQPYMVAGRRSPAPARQLDAAWEASVRHVTEGGLAGLPLIVGGRSLGARVACRSASALGAIGILCLAFPLQPPARKGREPSPSRLPELEGAGVPVLVVQGDRDQFGMPPPGPERTVAVVAGDHGLKDDLDAVAGAVRNWLGSLLDA